MVVYAWVTYNNIHSVWSRFPTWKLCTYLQKWLWLAVGMVAILPTLKATSFFLYNFATTIFLAMKAACVSSYVFISVLWSSFSCAASSHTLCATDNKKSVVLSHSIITFLISGLLQGQQHSTHTHTLTASLLQLYDSLLANDCCCCYFYRRAALKRSLQKCTRSSHLQCCWCDCCGSNDNEFLTKCRMW